MHKPFESVDPRCRFFSTLQWNCRTVGVSWVSLPSWCCSYPNGTHQRMGPWSVLHTVGLVWGKWGLKRGLDKTSLTRDPCGHRAHREPAYGSKTRCANVLAGGCVTQTAARGASITSNEEATQETWELWCSFCCPLCLLGQVISLELNPLKHVCTFDLCGLVSLCWKRFRTCLCHGGKGSGNSLGYPENSNPLDYIRWTISGGLYQAYMGGSARATFLGRPSSGYLVIPCNVVQGNGMEWNLI